MENLNFFLPEIFLSMSIFVTLLIGVFIKNSYGIVTKIIYAVIISSILIIGDNFNDNLNLFSNAYTSNSLTNFFSFVLILYS